MFMAALHVIVYFSFSIEVLMAKFTAGMPFESIGTIDVIDKWLPSIYVALKLLGCVQFLLPNEAMPSFQAQPTEVLFVLLLQMCFELVFVLKRFVLLADQAHGPGYSLHRFEVFSIGKVHVCLLVFPHAPFFHPLFQRIPLDQVLTCNVVV